MTAQFRSSPQESFTACPTKAWSMSARFSTLCLVLAMCLHIGHAQDCECPTPDDGYELFPSYNTSRYKMPPFLLNWADAVVACQSDGGGSHLVVINSQEEADVIGALVTDLAGWGVWVGISDINTETIWRTVLGGLVSESGYNKWTSGEPNEGTDGNCGYVVTDSLYRDQRCSLVLPFICEKPVA